MLTSRNVEMRGGRVSYLYEKWLKVPYRLISINRYQEMAIKALNVGRMKEQRDATGKGPPPWVPFGKDIERTFKEYERGTGWVNFHYLTLTQHSRPRHSTRRRTRRRATSSRKREPNSCRRSEQTPGISSLWDKCLLLKGLPLSANRLHFKQFNQSASLPPPHPTHATLLAPSRPPVPRRHRVRRKAARCRRTVRRVMQCPTALGALRQGHRAHFQRVRERHRLGDHLSSS